MRVRKWRILRYLIPADIPLKAILFLRHGNLPWMVFHDLYYFFHDFFLRFPLLLFLCRWAHFYWVIFVLALWQITFFLFTFLFNIIYETSLASYSLSVTSTSCIELLFKFEVSEQVMLGRGNSRLLDSWLGFLFVFQTFFIIAVLRVFLDEAIVGNKCDDDSKYK